jgi:arylsulfatase A-like enzyme/Flp pilus assembly protein TadD
MRRLQIHFSLLCIPLFLSVLVLSAHCRFSQEKEGRTQNLLLITIDTLRADSLGCYGGLQSKTPNIDRLAANGVLFSRAFANTSTTLPSHANIHLGTTPLHHGVHENLNFVVSDQFLTLAEHLKNNGFATGAFVGAYPLDARFGLSQGFDVYDDSYSRTHYVNPSSLERRAEDVVESALKWLTSQQGKWFLWIHCWDPHSPYEPPEPFASQYGENPYLGEVAYIDSTLGTLFDFIDTHGLRDSTAVVFTGDHGESLGQHGEKTHGFFAYNSTLWIPLIISVPGEKQGRTDAYVSHVDIFPTACDILGIEKPTFLNGRSLQAALRGKRPRERPIYFESLYPYYSRGWAPLRGYIHRKKKFIDSPIPELYELDKDFDELQNLARPGKTGKNEQMLANMMGELTPKGAVEAKRQVDQETREKLGSLGYISNRGVGAKTSFGAGDDVKSRLPFLNRADDAMDLFRQGKEEEALGRLLAILDERKDIDAAYQQLSSLYKSQGRIEDALAVLEQGLENLPANYEIFQDYIRVLLSVGRYDSVIESFEKMLLRETEFDPEAWNNLGIAYAKKGNFTKSIEACELGLALDDRYPELYHNLGNTYYSLGLQTNDSSVFYKCFDLYKKAIELDPGYPEPYFGLGHAYLQSGNIEGAVYCWEKTLELEPEFHQAYSDLAMIYFNSGNKDKACRLLTEYKNKFYERLPPADKNRFDEIMKNCDK